MGSGVRAIGSGMSIDLLYQKGMGSWLDVAPPSPEAPHSWLATFAWYTRSPSPPHRSWQRPTDDCSSRDRWDGFPDSARAGDSIAAMAQCNVKP